MSKVIYSLVVEFDKDKAPLISANLDVLGGRLVGVSFSNLIEENFELQHQIDSLEEN